ncbi:MAG: penicillin-binding protein 1B [Pseudomonadota bacterium]
MKARGTSPTHAKRSKTAPRARAGTRSKKRKTKKKKTLKSTRKPARKRVRAKRTPSVRRRLLTGLLALMGVALLMTALYGLVLDAQIKERFAGQPWAQPARVFARPIDLYAGLSLAPAELVAHLNQLGYRRVEQPTSPGEYRLAGQQLRLVTRGDSLLTISVQALDVYFAGDVIVELNDGRGDALPLATLEPQMIGSLLPRSGVDRNVIGADAVPTLLRAALVAVEDRRFHSHHGIDFRGIARAALANLRAGRVRQGGSTITQQLIKSHFLSNAQTWRRKFKEALMAVSIDARLSKDDIMLAYVNEIYLGQDGGRAIHGFDLASRFYFSRRLSELEIHHIAMLTGMVKGPSQFNPRRYPEAARKRRDLVLDILSDEGVISAEAALQAKAEPLDVVADRTGHFGGYPAIMAMVRQQLLRDYEPDDLVSAGLSVYTSLDVVAQQRVEQQVGQALAQVEREHDVAEQLQTSAVVLAPDTGELMALVGGRQIGFDGFNRALDMRRPIGSLIKPFVYLTALEHGQFDLDTELSNAPLDVTLDTGQIWSPRNFDDEYGGDVPIFKALAQSYNTPAVRVGLEIGVQNVIETLQRLGMAHDPDAFPSLLLGALELTPLEVAQLYLGLAGSGFITPPRIVKTVTDANGRALRAYPLEVEDAVSPVSTYQIMRTLRLAATHGTARSLSWRLPGLPVAGKTGSTNDLRDSWFAGVSQSSVAVVWVGRDDNESTGLTGAQGALPVWVSAMRALDNAPLAPYPPEDLHNVPFDYTTGQPLPYCDSAVLIPLRRQSEPPPLAVCR